MIGLVSVRSPGLPALGWPAPGFPRGPTASTPPGISRPPEVPLITLNARGAAASIEGGTSCCAVGEFTARIATVVIFKVIDLS